MFLAFREFDNGFRKLLVYTGLKGIRNNGCRIFCSQYRSSDQGSGQEIRIKTFFCLCLTRKVFTTFLALLENHKVKTIIKPAPRRKVVGVGTFVPKTPMANSLAGTPEMTQAS